MPPSRRRTTRKARARSWSGPWLLLVLLVLAGAAVFAARTFGRVDDTRAVPATATVAGPVRTPTLVAEQRQLPVATPTAVQTRAVAAATVRATPTRGITPTAVAHAAAAAPTATLVAARTATAQVPVQADATHAPQATATRVTAATATAVPATAVQAHATPVLTGTAVPVRSASGTVALTFDAGADRGYAEDILDRLAEDHVVASFGITGAWARANPDLVRRMAADGHLVFNHTLDHRSFTGVSDSLGGLSAAQRRAELDQADAIIAPLIGHSTRPFYRLPYGDDDAHVAGDVGPDGYTRKIGWTVDSEGWRGLLSQDILARCLKLAAPSAVYVFHVGRASQDAVALPQLIAGLRERGFTFNRVDQL